MTSVLENIPFLQPSPSKMLSYEGDSCHTHHISVCGILLWRNKGLWTTPSERVVR